MPHQNKMVEKGDRKNKPILVIAAHPDDEVLGCGGTAAKLARMGHSVFTVILGEGITSRDKTRNRQNRSEELKNLKSCIEKAAQIIQIKKTYFFDFPDNRFDSVDLLDIVKIIENIKMEVKPEIIFTHHGGDLNVDHQITFQAVMTACRPLKDETVRAIYSFEVPSSTEWNSPYRSDYFKPNFFMDISETIPLKMKAMEQYQSEIRTFPHPRSVKGLEIIAQNRGMQVGLLFAEAFEVVRIINY